MEQNPQKKIILVIGGLVILLGIIFSVYSLFTRPNTNPSPVSPTTVLTPTLFPTVRAESINQLQTLADENWSKKTIEVQNEFPWLDRLPLQTDNYFVYFDINEKKFYGKIYNKDQETQIREEITTRLRELDIDTTSYEFTWE